MNNLNRKNEIRRPRLPPWIRVKVHRACEIENVNEILENLSLNTVCRSAKCPNLSECWHKHKATFMILGNKCTRNCKFCALEHHKSPSHPNPEEAASVALAAQKLGLRYIVVTSVTRDDLPDGGAEQFSSVIREIRKKIPSAKIEVLTPDFMGCKESIEKVVSESPDVFNHNLETVERLTPEIRSGADYKRSLNVLATAYKKSNGKVRIKSGLMAGLGESNKELRKAITDIRETGAEILTIGQYLPPNENSRPLERYLEPAIFARLKDFALLLGFKSVASGPLVRSSYNADLTYNELKNWK